MRWSLRAAVTAGIVAYIAATVDPRHLARALAGVRPGLVAEAFVLYLVGQWLSALKWALLGRSVGIDRPTGAYIRFYFIGMFVNVLGLSTLGGDVVRALYLSGGRRRGLAFNSVLFDRASGLALLMALGAGAVVAFPDHRLPPWLTATMLASGAGLLVGWWACPWLVRILPRTNPVRRQVEIDLRPFWRDRILLVRAAALSIAFHLLQVGVQVLLVRAAGAGVSFSYALVFHPVLSLVQALPVSIGGFGVREGGYLYFLGVAGIDDSVAVTVGLLWWLVTLLGGLVGGAFLVAAGGTLPRLRAAGDGVGAPAGRPRA